MKSPITITVVVLAAWVGVASAQDAAKVKTEAAGLTAMQTMTDGEMRDATGGQEEPINIALASSQSSVTGNQIGNIGSTGAAGANTVSNNSGLTTLIANTGNQVVISQSTIVNVFLH